VQSSLQATAMNEKDHPDIRWNPDLQEWFCAKCGLTSDHAAKQDAVTEMAAFDCCILGVTPKKLGDKERSIRAHYLAQKQKQR
jgi:hypothetical protein